MYHFPISKQRVTLPFASVESPYSASNPHKGVDLAPFAGSFGEPITLPWDAKVISKQYSSVGLGNAVSFEFALPFLTTTTNLRGQMVTINPNNPMVMRMGHMQSISTPVKEGALLESGSEVGKIGNTGFSFGAHVHIDIQTNAGDFIDPLPILRQALEENKKEPLPRREVVVINIEGFEPVVFKGDLVIRDDGRKIDVRLSD